MNDILNHLIELFNTFGYQIIKTSEVTQIALDNYMATGEGLEIDSPMFIWVLGDAKQNNPYSDILSVSTQVIAVDIYLILGNKDLARGTFTSTASPRVIDVDVLNSAIIQEGQTLELSVDPLRVKIVEVNGNEVTVDQDVTEDGNFGVDLQNECYRVLDLVRLDVDSCISDSVELLREKLLTVGPTLPLNATLAGNRLKLWSGKLNLEYVEFYED